MKKFSIIILALFFVSCSPTTTNINITQSTETKVLPVETGIPTKIATPTATPTEVPPDIFALTTDEVVRLYKENKIKYPNELPAERRAEFAIALAEVINQQSGGSIEITKTFNNVEYFIYWDTNRGKWRSEHNTPVDELDKTGDSFPALVAPGYLNDESLPVLIDPVTGKETIIQSIIFPNWGEFSLVELYTLSTADLKSHLGELAAQGFKNKSPNFATAEKLQKIIDYYNAKELVIPIIIDPNNPQNETYAVWNSPANAKGSIPEASVTFNNFPTNVVLMPVFDSDGQLICFVRVHQSPALSSGIVIFGNDDVQSDGIGIFDRNAFGKLETDSFGVILLDDNIPFSDNSVGPLLEGEKGIGYSATIQKLLKVDTVAELEDSLANLRVIFVHNTDTIVQR